MMFPYNKGIITVFNGISKVFALSLFNQRPRTCITTFLIFGPLFQAFVVISCFMIFSNFMGIPERQVSRFYSFLFNKSMLV